MRPLAACEQNLKMLAHTLLNINIVIMLIERATFRPFRVKGGSFDEDA